MANLKKKIHIIGSAGIPARYGGFETFTEQVARILCEDFDISVYCSSQFYSPNEQDANWNGIRRLFLPISANGFRSIIYDLKGIRKSRRSADTIIILGVGTGLFLFSFTKRIRQKIWLHIDGIEWKRKKWNFFAKQFLYISFRFGIKFAKKILIDNEALIKTIPERLRSKIILTSYGGNHLPPAKGPSQYDFPYALMIARAEPENNLELVLEAFIARGQLKLIVVSNWENTKYGRRLLKKFSEHPLISLLAANYNQEILQNYRKYCKYYIHAHSAGGTNPSLIEAMFSNRPIFIMNNDFNRNTSNELAYYFNSKEELINLLENTKESDLRKSAQLMYSYAMEYYSWKRVGNILRQNF